MKLRKRNEFAPGKIVIFKGSIGLYLADLKRRSFGIILGRRGKDLRVKWEDGKIRHVYTFEVDLWG